MVDASSISDALHVILISYIYRNFFDLLLVPATMPNAKMQIVLRHLHCFGQNGGLITYYKRFQNSLNRRRATEVVVLFIATS